MRSSFGFSQPLLPSPDGPAVQGNPTLAAVSTDPARGRLLVLSCKAPSHRLLCLIQGFGGIESSGLILGLSTIWRGIGENACGRCLDA
jgi:hypothetical protein